MVRQPLCTESTLPELLFSAAQRFPDKPFLMSSTASITFGQMLEQTQRAATGLRECGIGAGDRVTLWMENGWQWVASYYGALSLGAVVNSANILLTTDEVGFMVDDCGSRLILTSSPSAPELALRCQVRAFSTDNRLGKGAADGWVEPFERLLSHRMNAESEEPLPISPDSPAAIGYTSGTTGNPKGAVLSHRSVVTNALMTALMHGRTHEDVIVSALPCSHVYGNIVMNSAVAVGASLVLLPRFVEESVLWSIQHFRATLFEGVPTMYMKLMNHESFTVTDFSSLKRCTVGGQTMPLATMLEVERLFGCRLLELWGMTEIGGLGTTHPYCGPRKLGSIGVALPLSEVKVVSTHPSRAIVPLGDTGELVIRGPLVMHGYYGNASGTAEVIDEQGWLHTGDLVRQDPDGYLYVVDRIKEVIINGGYNVYPAEVEQVIAQLEAVSMVAVAAARDAFKGQTPKAFVVLKAGCTCEPDDVIRHCRARLAAYKVPTAVDFVSDLPKNSTGKILRRMLSESSL